jgi:hypothetical protein
MKIFSLLSLGLVCAETVGALTLVERGEPAVVAFDVERREVDPALRRRMLSKKDSTVEIDIVNPVCFDTSNPMTWY